MFFKDLQNSELKKIQARFFNGNVLAQSGNYLAADEVDQLRKAVLKPFKSKKFNENF